MKYQPEASRAYRSSKMTTNYLHIQFRCFPTLTRNICSSTKVLNSIRIWHISKHPAPSSSKQNSPNAQWLTFCLTMASSSDRIHRNIYANEYIFPVILSYRRHCGHLYFIRAIIYWLPVVTNRADPHLIYCAIVIDGPPCQTMLWNEYMVVPRVITAKHRIVY